MAGKLINLFFVSSGFVLILTAMAKYLSSFGSVQILNMPDPVFNIPFRDVFRAAAIVELLVACVCLFVKSIYLRASVLAWVSSIFVVYRFGLVYLHYHKPCNCLGSMTQVLHIPQQIADMGIRIVLIYLFVGSYGILFWLWRQRKTKACISVPMQ